MKIYYFNQRTGEFIKEGKANISPANPDNYLIPGNATKKAPPETGENEVAVFQESDWSIEADYRGQEYYDQESQKHTITEIGIEPKEDWQKEKPQSIIEKEKIEAEIRELERELERTKERVATLQTFPGRETEEDDLVQKAENIREKLKELDYELKEVG